MNLKSSNSHMRLGETPADVEEVALEEVPATACKRSRSKHLYQRSAKKRQDPARIAYESNRDLVKLNDPDLEAVDAEKVADVERREAAIQSFRKYYKLQAIVPEDEFELLMRSLFKPLPVSFRECPAGDGRQEELRFALVQLRALLAEGDVPGGAPPAHSQLAWASAWQLIWDDRQLRQSAKLAPQSAPAGVAKWLVKAVDRGLVTRQEVVSMCPVALLQVQRHHLVLDLCASPGSKTSQALEMLHQPNPDSTNLDSSEEEPSRGFVVANELVPLRAYVLAARCGALGAACRRLVVTSHRAQIFPRSTGSDGYDRIICDVPCSGDGTFRKYRDKWGHWEAHLGRQLHSLQLQIAVRAASLLKRGGVMAYSTCSMNPLEDEAVVAALLKRCNGALELVKCSHRLDGFEARPGMREWVVADEDRMKVYPSLKELKKHMEPPETTKRYRESMWPPKEGSKTAVALERCVRVFPHLQNTGGFFIALIKKVRDWPTGGGQFATRTNEAGRRRRANRHSGQETPSLESSAAPPAALRACLAHLHLLPGVVRCAGEDLTVPPREDSKTISKKTKGNREETNSEKEDDDVGVLCARSPAPNRVFLVSTELADHLGMLATAREELLRGSDLESTTDGARALNIVAAGVCVAERRLEPQPVDPLQEGNGCIPIAEAKGLKRWALTLTGAALLWPAARMDRRVEVGVDVARVLLERPYCPAPTGGPAEELLAVPGPGPVFVTVRGSPPGFNRPLPGWAFESPLGGLSLVLTLSTKEKEAVRQGVEGLLPEGEEEG
eukprot:CAMPEP_0198200294 /NCGR_PEP_ID=MMETSP1445-20131203/3334_1 /TAXON_ID=36898 /ORGANISM="Pyramimonas sp., Strain CCMP2087" /LENGTH=783 /DNA_ID=CAMNT_0043870315 /DNA_START=153 /DNA_END=2504 /DNA_ORIENTATION=+